MAKSLVPMPTYTYYRGQKITLTLAKGILCFIAIAHAIAKKKYRNCIGCTNPKMLQQVLKLQKA